MSNAFIDRFICEVDKALRSVIVPQNRAAQRQSPAHNIAESPLAAHEKKHISGLMRVNHAGEVCAQALYQGQALTAQLAHIKEQMQQAAAEETDHLAWCEQRIHELGSYPSKLNVLWYSGSFFIGALAGLAGDTISLGFVAETERQVSKHLQNHIQSLPPKDMKTRAILQKMQADEAHHATIAQVAGAVELPFVIRQLMALISKVMTKTSYYI